MRCCIYILVLFWAVQVTNAQKFVKKALVNSEISHISLNTEHCFEVSLETVASDNLTIEAYMEGEYEKDLLIKVREEGNTIHLSAGFNPNFRDPNDKLSAHKVVSIALKVSLPEIKNVLVYGTNTNVKAEGKYAKLKILLDDGRCILNGASYDTEVTTQSGKIVLNASEGELMVSSKYGSIPAASLPKGPDRFKLQSVSGDIVLNKIN